MSGLFRFFAAAAAAIIGAGVAPASAQTSNTTLSGGGIMNYISASDVAAMMAELGVASELVSVQGAPILIATTGGGGRFHFRFFACDDDAQAVNCRHTIVSAALPAAGVTFDDVNNFNGNAIVTTAISVPQQQIVLFGRNIIIVGGHSRDLFKGTVYLFLRDIDSFASQTSSAASIAFSPSQKPGSKISGLQSGAASAPKQIFGINDIGPEVSAAITNTKDVNFEIDYTPAQ